MARGTKGIRTNAKHLAQELPAKFTPGVVTRHMDGRAKIARLLRDKLNAIVADQGGLDTFSTVKLDLLERYVWLGGILSGMEARAQALLGSAEPADQKQGYELVARIVQAHNSYLGMQRQIGYDVKSLGLGAMIPKEPVHG